MIEVLQTAWTVVWDVIWGGLSLLKGAGLFGLGGGLGGLALAFLAGWTGRRLIAAVLAVAAVAAGIFAMGFIRGEGNCTARLERERARAVEARLKKEIADRERVIDAQRRLYELQQQAARAAEERALEAEREKERADAQVRELDAMLSTRADDVVCWPADVGRVLDCIGREGEPDCRPGSPR